MSATPRKTAAAWRRRIGVTGCALPDRSGGGSQGGRDPSRLLRHRGVVHEQVRPGERHREHAEAGRGELAAYVLLGARLVDLVGEELEARLEESDRGFGGVLEQHVR